MTRPCPCSCSGFSDWTAGLAAPRPPRPATEGRRIVRGHGGAGAATLGTADGPGAAGSPGGRRPQRGPRSFRDLREEEALPMRRGRWGKGWAAELGSLWRRVSPPSAPVPSLSSKLGTLSCQVRARVLEVEPQLQSRRGRGLQDTPGGGGLGGAKGS